MISGQIPLKEATDAILAHTLQLPNSVIKKGTILTKIHLDEIAASGATSVVCARLEAGDIGEDTTAQKLAALVAGNGVTLTPAHTGRCNLLSEVTGIFNVDPELIYNINIQDEGLTIATLRSGARVKKGQIVATVKIIPFAVNQKAFEKVQQQTGRQHLSAHPFIPQQAGVVLTRLPNGKEKLLDKARDSLTNRLEDRGSCLSHESRCNHSEIDVAKAITELKTSGCELIIICGATATVDRNDIAPAGIALAGGQIECYGMPVDPGNLLLTGWLGETRIIGMPGCARSPKLNGFDWVLDRHLCGLPITRTELANMGVGGLLEEMPSRTLPRERAVTSNTVRIAPDNGYNIPVLILAAGTDTSSEILSKTIEIAHSSHADQTIVVTSPEPIELSDSSLSGNYSVIINPDYNDGISSSIRAGLNALTESVDGVVICLADMPWVDANQINRLIDTFDPEMDQAICVSTHHGKRGNPVLWARYFFPEMMQLQGNIGARHLIEKYPDYICEVEASNSGVLLDAEAGTKLSTDY